jgi:hypothetical protein
VLVSRTTGRRCLAALLAAAVLTALLPFVHVQLLTGRAASPVGGTYHALSPARILDTRTGSGAPKARLGAGGVIDVQVAGQGGAPSSGISAAVLNVTVTNTTAPSFLTVYPAGTPIPVTSNLNWLAGQTVPNLVTVGLGTGSYDGKVAVRNSAGATDVIFDVAGYYTTPDQSPGPDGLFNPLVPSRLLDTRNGTGAPLAKLGGATTLNLQVTGRGGVPSAGVSAVVLNVTATNPSAASFLTVFSTGVPRPNASNVNFVAGQTVPNRAIVRLGGGGQVSFYNASGTTDVVADVNGWFTDSTAGGAGSRFVPMPPTRFLDSRFGIGGYFTQWGPGGGRPVAVAGVGGVPGMGDADPPTAVVANVTVTGPTAAGVLTAWPDGGARPLASDLNWTRGLTVPNLIVVQVGPTGNVDLFNSAGCVSVVMDVVGWYTGPAPSVTPAPPPADIPCPGAGPWLARLNYWRSTARVPGVTANTTWNAGDYNHALYMVKNQQVTHYEISGYPYYTTAGDTAARNSNIEVNSTASFTDNQAIDWWMGAPFHAMNLMDPRLKEVGFGSYRETRSGWQAGFALDVIRGNSFTGGTYPVFWPGNGATVPLRTYSGHEFPNPLQACSGYSVPVGLPVFVQVGGNVATTAGAHSFTGNGTPLEHCVIDSHNSAVGSMLASRGGVIVIPRQPLQPGVTYAVSLTVNSVAYSWSFQVT